MGECSSVSEPLDSDQKTVSCKFNDMTFENGICIVAIEKVAELDFAR